MSEITQKIEYVKGARSFMNSSSSDILIKVRSNGLILKYHPESNTFGVMNPMGAPKTLFRPKDGLDYWLKQN